MITRSFDSNKYVLEAKRLLDLVHPQIDSFIGALYQAFVSDRTVFIIGNGGSASNASHLAQDLNKGTLHSPDAVRRFHAIALTDNLSWITAIANDHGYESIFEYQLRSLAHEADVLVAISGSGNSPNVLRAVEYANARGITTIGITGYDGGKLKPMAALNVQVPSFDMGLVEGVHSILFHLTMAALRDRLRSQ